MAISLLDAPTVKEVGEHLAIPERAAGDVLRELQQQGMVETREDLSDGRRRCQYLTASGTATMRRFASEAVQTLRFAQTSPTVSEQQRQRRERKDLRARLDVLRVRGAAGRRHELVDLVALMARRSQFQVDPGLGLKRRENVDFVASLGAEAFLFHIAALESPARVEDVHGFWKELGDEASDLIGVLVSPTDFDEDVTAQIVQSPFPPTVLIGPQELEYLAEWPDQLRRIVELKVDRLRRHRQVIGSEVLAVLDWRPESNDADEVWLVDESGYRLDWVMASGDFGRFTFASPNNLADERGSADLQRLDLRLAVAAQTELLALLDELEDLGWVTGNGRWSIQQMEVNWHGVSADDLRTALLDWERRYEQAGEVKMHSSEDVVYSDANLFGAYTMSFNVEAYEERHVWHAFMSVVLPGIPLDLQPYQELARTAGDTSMAFLRGGLYDGQKSWWPPAGADLPKLEPLAWVVSHSRMPEDDEDYCCGIVVANPFLDAEVAATLAKGPPDALREADLIVCSVGQWHPLDRRPSGYHLMNVNWAHMGEGVVVEVRAGWDDLPDID